MATITLYHNPRCSKSRQALALLEAQNIPFEVIEYLKAPLTQSQLKKLVKQLGVDARALMRTSEAEYKDNDLANANLSDADLLAAIAEHPKLMQRPIVVHENKAVIGRPPELILEII